MILILLNLDHHDLPGGRPVVGVASGLDLDVHLVGAAPEFLRDSDLAGFLVDPKVLLKALLSLSLLLDFNHLGDLQSFFLFLQFPLSIPSYAYNISQSHITKPKYHLLFSPIAAFVPLVIPEFDDFGMVFRPYQPQSQYSSN